MLRNVSLLHYETTRLFGETKVDIGMIIHVKLMKRELFELGLSH